MSLNVVAPEVFTPTEDEVPPALVVRLVSAVPPPIRPPNTVAPLSLTASVTPPFTVSAKATFTPLTVVFTPSVTASP